MKIYDVSLYRVSIPLNVPYVSSLQTLSDIETVVCEVRDEDGRCGVGDTTIIEGYTHETKDGGWAFCVQHAEKLVGVDTAAAKKALDPFRRSDPHAVSAIQVAVEMLEGNPILQSPGEPVRFPILGPVNTKKLDAIPDEVEGLIEKGYGTLKIKVGWEVDADLERVQLIQRANAGRARLRIDANQGYTREDAIRFATSLESDGDLELFEQPCDKTDWEGNAAVAAVSKVPLMPGWRGAASSS